MITARLCAIPTLFALWLAPWSAHAADCYSTDGASGLPWNTRLVKVFVHFDRSQTEGPWMGLRFALDLSQMETEHVVIRTINILNEEVGGAVKLQYSGTTDSWDNIEDAIVLRSSKQECSDGSDGVEVGAIAAASAAASNGYRARGQIHFYRQVGGQAACVDFPYTTAETRDTDVVSILSHELGHVFYDVGHPNDRRNFDCNWNGESSRMTVGSDTWPGQRTRVVRDWDRQIFQLRHGSRGFASRLRVGFSNSSCGSWCAPGLVDAPHILYPPGSMSQHVMLPKLGFVYHDDYVPQQTGGGLPHAGLCEGFQIIQTQIGLGASLAQPIAMASRPDTEEVIAAYVKRSFDFFGADSDIGHVCYLRSFDGGYSFEPETCHVQWEVHRIGLTAAYSANDNVFLIAFLDEGHFVSAGIVPASDNTTVPAGHKSRLGSTAVHASWHAPAIACTTDQRDTMGCRLVWEEKSNLGCRTTVFAGVDPGNANSAPSVISGSPYVGSCFPMYSTVGLVYNRSTNIFQLSFTSKNDAIYGFYATSGGASWFGDGDIWNQTDSYVLSGVLSYSAGPERSEAWFVEYMF